MATTPNVRQTHRKIRASDTIQSDVSIDAPIIKLNGTPVSSVVPLAGTVMTQTYSTADATVPAATTHTITDSSTGAASTTALAAMTGVDGSGSNAAPLTATKDNIATLGAEAELLKADLLALKKVVNQIIDDLQVAGIEA